MRLGKKLSQKRRSIELPFREVQSGTFDHIAFHTTTAAIYSQVQQYIQKSEHSLANSRTMQPQPKRLQIAGSPKCRPPKFGNPPEKSGPAQSAGSTGQTAKAGSRPIEDVACQGCKALAMKMRTMEKRLATLEMVKIRASTLNGREYQIRANISDYVITIKETIQKFLGVENIHLYYKDMWLNPDMKLDAYYTGREADINVVIIKEDTDPPSRPSQTIDPHLAWQPFRGDHEYWSDAETPILLDGDPLTLPQTEATDPWFHPDPPGK